MPPVARDQPNGFRLTPHTPRSKTSPPLLLSPLPSRWAMSVQNTPDETLLFYWLWYLSPFGALSFDTLPPVYSLVAVTAAIFDTSIRTILIRLVGPR